MHDYHPQHPHDVFFRRTFEVAGHTRSLLKSYLPAKIFRSLRLQTLEPARETFLSPGEHEKRLDLLYTARYHDGTPVLIYLLLEHKSYIDRHIALQLLGYVLRILEWRKRNGQPPCVIIPIVIYHGDAPWDEPTSLRDKVAADEPLTAFVPDMQVILADLRQLSPESLADTPELEARIRTLQLSRRSEPEFESIATIFRLLRDWAKKDSQKEALKDIFLYLCQVFNAQRISWFNQAIKTGLQIESETQMPTIYEVLIEPRLEQGIREGIEKGEVIGRIRAFQEVLRQPVDSKEQLLLLTHDELQSRAQQLQQLLATGPR
ncbi:MAG: Rpn family recombination-promoting nuclease/putative transposase [Planctomycetaceae bacterium]